MKHSQERAISRYNLYLTHQDEQNILAKLRANDMIFLGTSETDLNRKFAYVLYKNIPLKVLYIRGKRGIKGIVTVYPFDVDEYNIKQVEAEQKKINGAIRLLKKNGYTVLEPDKNSQDITADTTKTEMVSMNLNITKEEFIKMYYDLTYAEMQKKLNISSATIAKLAKKLNLSKPKGARCVDFRKTDQVTD